MLSYLLELLMSFVTLVLGFFGIDIKKKSVSFADDTEKKESESVPSFPENEPSTESTQ